MPADIGPGIDHGASSCGLSTPSDTRPSNDDAHWCCVFLATLSSQELDNNRTHAQFDSSANPANGRTPGTHRISTSFDRNEAAFDC
jgi:hypothetical protein